jgi:uncharacterized protein (TIGR03437 family)
VTPAATLALLFTLPLQAQVNVLTYQYDNTRAGANRSEIVLTPVNVSSSTFGKLFSYPVDGLIYGQPLYLANVSIPGKGTHNVVYVATQHDSVYAFDADTNTPPLWTVNFLGAGATTVPNSDVGCSQIAPELGITSTPVIDPAGGTIYVVAMTKESGSYVHRLHALDLATGAEMGGSPVTIQASYPGTGEGGTTLVFQPRSYKQRPGLLLLNGIVYLAWASHCDIGRYHGWLMAYDARTLEQVGVYNNTPNGNQGAFWHGGAAPAVDENGNIYLVAGNGTFDYATGGPDLGESYIKLTPGLGVEDYFAPFNFATLNQRDLDVGSAGVALLGDEAGSADHPHLMAGAGKEGRLYLLDRDNLGGWRNTVDDGQIVASSGAGAIGGLFGNPSYFNHTVYFCGSGDSLKAYSVWNAVLSSGPSSVSPNRFGSPGCLPTISSDGRDNAIVWVYDASNVLRAFDARNLANELWNSNQNGARDALGRYVKFTVPMVADGKVYAGTQNALVVYGLLPDAPPPLGVMNAASAQQGRAAPGSMISIYGAGLAQSTDQAPSYPLPITLGGTSVTVNGVPAPLFYASPTRIDAQIPFETVTGNATVAINPDTGQGTQITIAIQASSPGLFMLDQGRAAVLNEDGSLNATTHGAPTGRQIAVALTGLGPVSPAVATGAAAAGQERVTGMVSATIGGRPAQVVFAGLAAGYAGLYQVNLIVPQLARGDYPLQITAGGTAANTAIVSVQ